ncbi:MAG: M48 family metalloprotease [Cyanobacteriota/Melainabacteria group bacterium]
MGNELPAFLPATRPRNPSVIDPDHLLSKADSARLEWQLQSLDYPALVIILPKEHGVTDLSGLPTVIEKTWGIKDNELFFLLDIKGRQLEIYRGPALTKRGISESVTNNILRKSFFPAAKKGDFAGGISETLSTIENAYKTSNYRQYQTQGDTVEYVGTGRSSGNGREPHHDQLSLIGGILFVAVVIMIVITLRFKGKGEQEIDLRKSRDKYNQHMEKIIALFNEKPQEFFLRVTGLICLGYAYIAMALVVLITFTLFTFILLMKMPYLAFKLGLPLLLVLGVIFRSFWIKTPPPAGIKLKKKDYPKVYEIVEEIRSGINAPPVHQIQLIPDFNASVMQRPRLGLLGWQKNYLMLGIQLLKTCSYDEIRSILAHELGHLAEGHSAKDAWIYRVQGVWYQLMQNLHNDQSIATVIFTRFFDWYVPLLDSYTFPYRREQEESADELSVKLVGPELAANTFLSMDLKSHYLEKYYWENVGERYSSPEPPAVYEGMTEALKNGKIEKHDAEIWLHESLKVETGYEDSHPCTRDRVATILKIKPEEVKDYAHSVIDELCRIENPAFDQLFPVKGKDLCEALDNEYKEFYKEYWLERHQSYNEAKKELEDLLTKKTEGEISEEEAATCAYTSLIVHGFAKSRDLFKEALDRNPEDATLRRTYGQQLLDNKDPDCVGYLEAAMKLDRQMQYECGQMLYGFFKSKDDEDRAKHYEEMVIDWIEESIQRQKEVSDVKKDDIIFEHDLKDEVTAAIAEVISQFVEVKVAYLVRKQVKFFPERSFYIFLIEYDKKHISDAEKKEILLSVILQSIIELGNFTGDVIFYHRDTAPKNVLTGADMIANAVIYEK